MSETLGDISLAINVASIVLVSVGVFGRRRQTHSYLRHGYLSVLGFTLKLITVLFAMLPPLFGEVAEEIAAFSQAQLAFLGVKVTLGIVGTVLGFICIVPWLLKPRSDKVCFKYKRWMTPTLVIWILSVVLGAIVHLGGIV